MSRKTPAIYYMGKKYVSSGGGGEGTSTNTYGPNEPSSSIGQDTDIYCQIETNINPPKFGLDTEVNWYEVANDGNNIVLSGICGGYDEYVQYKLSGLQINEPCTISFTGQLIGSTDHYGSYDYGVYYNNTGFGSSYLGRTSFTDYDNDKHNYTLTFTPTAETVYVWFWFGDLRDDRGSRDYNIFDLNITTDTGIVNKNIKAIWQKNDETWVQDKFLNSKHLTQIEYNRLPASKNSDNVLYLIDNVQNVFSGDSQVKIKNAVGITTISSSVENCIGIYSGYEYSAGYEGFNIPLKNLKIGQNYNLSFDFQFTDAQYITGQHKTCYVISQSPKYNYSDEGTWPVDNLPRDEYKHSHSINFQATATTMYLAFNFCGLNDSTNNYFTISEIKVISVDEIGKIFFNGLVYGGEQPPDMIGATASNDGKHGLVPAPKISPINKFLSSDGEWRIPNDEYDIITSNFDTLNENSYGSKTKFVNNGIYLEVDETRNDWSSSASLYNNTAIDLTNYNSLDFEVIITEQLNYGYLYVTLSQTKYTWGTSTWPTILDNVDSLLKITDTGNYSIDVSNLTGNYYIYFCAVTGKDSVTHGGCINNHNGTIKSTITEIRGVYSHGGGTGGANTISDLTDVNLTSLSDGQILKYDSTSQKWINTDETGVSSSSGAVTLYKATDTTKKTFQLSDDWDNYETLLITMLPADPSTDGVFPNTAVVNVASITEGMIIGFGVSGYTWYKLNPTTIDKKTFTYWINQNSSFYIDSVVGIKAYNNSGGGGLKSTTLYSSQTYSATLSLSDDYTNYDYILLEGFDSNNGGYAMTSIVPTSDLIINNHIGISNDTYFAWYKITSSTSLSIDGKNSDDIYISKIYGLKSSGGSGGGSEVEANPSDPATDTLNTIGIDGTVYDIAGGGGGGNALIVDAQIYSEDEQVVGVWTDGKPLYEKTYVWNETISGSSTNKTISLDHPDYVFIESGHAINSAGAYLPLPYAHSNTSNDTGIFVWTDKTYVGFRVGTNTVLTKAVVTIRYTKTTDTAGSGGYQAYGFSPVIYSTEEREIGVGENNKPLYQKTITSQSLSAESGEVVLTGIDSLKVISLKTNTEYPFYISTYNVSGSGTEYGLVRLQNGNVTFYNASRQTAIIIEAVLQYTKTTDTAGSGSYNTLGVPTVHYTTDEQVIGTWIDGKPLYRRTFYYDNQSGLSSGDNKIIQLDSTINVTRLDGFLVAPDNNKRWILPYSKGSSTTSVIITDDHYINLYVNDDSWASTRKIYITIEYTKTTD